ncbi:MAG: ComEC/Rec2 family competence protein [Bacilli bacterium]
MLFTFFGVLFSYLGHLTYDVKQVNGLALVLESKSNYIIIVQGFNKYYIYLEDNPYQKFELLKVYSSSIEPMKITSYESVFSFEDYISHKGVYKALYDAEIKRIFTPLIQQRNIISFVIKEDYSSSSKAILSMLLFSCSYSKTWDNLIYKNGLSYVFSLSSYHIYFLIELIKKLLIKKYKEEKIDLFILFFLFFLLFISSYKISVLKIFLLKLIKFISCKKNKEISYRDTILLVYLIILLLMPNYIYEEGFILSFSLSIFISYSTKGFRRIKRKYRSLVFSLYIYLFMIPFLINRSGTFSLVNPFLMFFFAPFSLVLYLQGMVFSLFPFYKINNYLCSFIYSLVLLLDNNKFYIVVGEINFVFIIIYYFLLILSVFFLEIKRNKMTKNVLLLQSFFILICALPIDNYISYEIDFINVGQGDAMIVRTSSTTIMVDTGGKVNMDLTSSSLIPFFHKRKIFHIDTLFITHEDYDHSGEKDRLISSFKVKEVISNSSSFYSKKIGDIKVTNLNHYYVSSDEENNKSLVLYKEIYDKSELCMGDAPIEIEKKKIKA